MNGIVQWLKLAMLRDVVRRATRTAMIVGLILTGINHGDEIVSGTLTRHGILQICLTIMVPYIVSTTSSVATLRGVTRPTGSVEATDTKSAARSRKSIAK